MGKPDMSRYAYDDTRNTLVCTWPTPTGDIARDVAHLEGSERDLARPLAFRLTQLSKVFWRTFTHPGSTALDGIEPNSDGWRRNGARDALPDALKAVTTANLPDHGTLVVSYTPTTESGHALGRLLAECGSPRLTAVVAKEVRSEIDAIELAEAGDLSGRAQQAASMSRPVFSQRQADAAHQLLVAEPFADLSTFANLEPVSAAVTAAEWLRCAAHIASKISGTPLTTVLEEADNIEALPFEVPTAVLIAMGEGVTAEEAITTLVRNALEIADGNIDMTLFAEHLPAISNPGPDLLEDLLIGIHGCFLLWKDYKYDDYSVPEGVDDEDPAYWESQYALLQKKFVTALRKRAREALRGR